MTTIADIFGWVWAIGILPAAIAFLAVSLVLDRRGQPSLKSLETALPEVLFAVFLAAMWPIVAAVGGIYVAARMIADRIPDPIDPAEQERRIREQEARIKELERELGIGGNP